MTPRFLMTLAREGCELPAPASQLASRTGLEIAMAGRGCLLLRSAGTGVLTLDDGAIVGSLFHRHGPARPVEVLSPSESDRIAASNGASLLGSFWGGYVAFVSGALPRLLRDPSGALPCYLVRRADCILIASHVELLLATGLFSTSIDWNALAAHLYRAGLPGQRTVLAGIEELLPGFSIDLAGDSAGQRACWTPWDHVRPGPQEEPRQIAERLRRIVLHCVQSWASSSKQLLLSVSGGLDSSIVAACLAGGKRVHCLTMFSDDAGGDERDYARALCTRLGLPLTECRYRVEDVDIEAPLGVHLPRPSGRTQAIAYERAHIELAGSIGADAFITGNGGDNVFGYSQSAAAIVDRYLVEGAGAGLLATLRDVCRQTGCSALEALRSAGRILRSPRPYRWQPSDSFLHPELLAELAEHPLAHPWLEAPPGGLPGKAGHIAGLLRVQPNLEPGRAAHAPVLNPLVSQPIMEACLSIPSWQWRSGGFDRSMARTAFSGDLPDMIVRRRSKGGPDGFTAQIISRYRSRISERLLEGRLAAHRLVDTAAIARVLADERPTLGEERTRLLGLLATEAWLDAWNGRLETLNRGGSWQERPSAGPSA
jgi:asparagine synthase (glutamine-hydrolysing)